MKFASFDLETADVADPLWMSEISCAAVAAERPGWTPYITYWKGIPNMSQGDCERMVSDFQDLEENGYTFLTWNGAGFDFRILAERSGMFDECAQLALNHVDMMLLVTFRKGWRLSLQAALKGAGLEGKLKTVTLSTGEEITDMSGSKAPELWQAGEYRAVLDYLKEDVLQPLALARDIEERKEITWISGRGRPQHVYVPKLITVRECFTLPEPDTSWMSCPPTRMSFIEWMPRRLRESL